MAAGRRPDQRELLVGIQQALRQIGGRLTTIEDRLERMEEKQKGVTDDMAEVSADCHQSVLST